jgi:uncharacterized protein (TIRG00374 family)
MLKKKWLFRVFGIALFIFILSRIDLAETINIISNTNLIYLAVAFTIVPFVVITKAYGWQLLMKMQNINYPLKDSVQVYFAGLFVGSVTPGKLGDFIKVFYLQEEGYSFGKSIVSVFMDRIFDLASLFIISYICMFVFMIFFKSQIIILSILFIIIAIIFVLLIFDKKKKLLKKIYNYFIPEKYKTKVKVNFDDFCRDFDLLKTPKLSLVVIITFISWIIYFSPRYLLALSMDIDISFFYLITCLSISAIITLIPISILGIGTRDMTLIALFSGIGLNKESAVAFSTMLLFMYVVNGLIGLLAWLKKPISLPIS